ncbi:hypothetical protein ACOMHN_007264 [Nucella lapillus]
MTTSPSVLSADKATCYDDVLRALRRCREHCAGVESIVQVWTALCRCGQHCTSVDNIVQVPTAFWQVWI